MPDLNLPAVAVATLIGFVSSGTYYAVLGSQLATVSPAAASDEQPPPWTYALELLRTLMLVIVVAVLISLTTIDTWSGGLLLGLLLWIGFPFILLTGSMLHERTPLKLAVIHAGDWLIKLVIVTVIVAISF